MAHLVVGEERHAFQVPGGEFLVGERVKEGLGYDGVNEAERPLDRRERYQSR